MAVPGHIYHWKHGWIPITPRAAMIKAKGSHRLGTSYMHRYHIEDGRTGPAERRTERVGEGAQGRGSFAYRKGTKTRDYPDRAPGGAPAGHEGDPLSPDQAFRMKKHELEHHASKGSKVAQRELDRRAAKGGHPAAPKKAEPKVAKKPLDQADDHELAKEVHRRGGTIGSDGKFKPGTASREVRPGDRNPGLEHYGDDELAKELHRRGGAVDAQGRHLPGGSAGTVPEPKAAPEVPKKAADPEADALWHHERENRRIEAELANGDKIGTSVTAMGDGDVFAMHKHEGPANASGKRDTLGYVVQNKDTGKFGALSALPSARTTKQSDLGTFDSRLDAHKAISAQLNRPETVSDAPVDDHLGEAARRSADVAGFGSDVHLGAVQRHANSIAERLGEGHRINTFAGKDYAWSAEGGSSSTVKIISKHMKDDPSSFYGKRDIGRVEQVEGMAGFKASHTAFTPDRRIKGKLKIDTTGKTTDLGRFDTQEEAHRAIARAQAAHEGTLLAKEAKKAAAAERKKSLVGDVAGPNGTTWKPYDVGEGHSNLAAAAVRSKTRQAYKAGDHTVVIETDLSAEQTKGLLKDVTNATERATPNLKGTGVKFLVPVGETWKKDGGHVGAFVHVGGTTVHINPKIADNSLAEQFARGGQTGHFSRAAKSLSGREYTLLHELGHVVDNVHKHTPGEMQHYDYAKKKHLDRWAAGMEHFHASATIEHGHSSYGKENPAEGYAEAFTQWTVGGKGSHPIADTYAERFGWKPGAEGEDARILRQNREATMRKADALAEQRRKEYQDAWDRGVATGGLGSLKAQAPASDEPSLDHPSIVRRAQAAMDILGGAEIDRLTNGHGLSGATSAELDRIIRRARAVQKVRGVARAGR